MGERYLIDTNVIVNFSERKLSSAGKAFIVSILDTEFHFSIINKIELLGFSVVRDDINELVEEAIVLNLSDAIADKAIAIRKNRRMKLPDEIIAATCVVHNLV